MRMDTFDAWEHVCPPLAHLVDAHQAVLGGVHVLPQLGVRRDAGGHASGVQLVQQGRLHAGRGAAVGVEAEVAAQGVAGADVGEDAAADARHVGGLGQVVAVVASPHQHIVRKMARQLVGCRSRS